MSYATRERKLEYMRGRYQRKKEELKEYQRIKRNLFNKIFLLHLKGKEGICQGCGEDHPGVLEFHHRDPKEKKGTLTRMMEKKEPLSLIQIELDKCDVLCCNCHALHHTSWTEEEVKEVWKQVKAGEFAIQDRLQKLFPRDKDRIHDLYHNDQLNIREIASIYEVDHTALHSFMIKYEIPRRTTWEGRILSQSKNKKLAEIYFKED